MNHIDRALLGAARVQGFQRDLGMTDSEWGTLIGCFFRASCQVGA